MLRFRGFDSRDDPPSIFIGKYSAVASFEDVRSLYLSGICGHSDCLRKGVRPTAHCLGNAVSIELPDLHLGD